MIWLRPKEDYLIVTDENEILAEIKDGTVHGSELLKHYYPGCYDSFDLDWLVENISENQHAQLSPSIKFDTDLDEIWITIDTEPWQFAQIKLPIDTSDDEIRNKIKDVVFLTPYLSEKVDTFLSERKLPTLKDYLLDALEDYRTIDENTIATDRLIFKFNSLGHVTAVKKLADEEWL